MHWWLPLKGSTFAGDIDGLFLAILIITGIAFVVVEAGLIWFVIKYRQRPGRKAFYTHGNTRAEVIWTTIPAVTMVALEIGRASCRERVEIAVDVESSKKKMMAPFIEPL